MKPLGMTFKLDDVIESGRELRDELSTMVLEECVSGLIGKLGYRPSESAVVEGNIYRTANDEIIVDARLKTMLRFDCVRCLQEGTLNVDTRTDHVLVRGESKPAHEDLELTEADLHDEADTFEGDEINLEPMFRQDLILALPMNPTCEDGERGPCESITTTVEVNEDFVDPRWAPLADLKKKLKPKDGADE